jgi:toxin ParE1/3/4
MPYARGSDGTVKTMAQIIWSFRAIENLEEICKFIANDSPLSAVKFAITVKTRVEALGSSPFIGRIVPDQKGSVDKNLRELILGNYRIVYHIDTEMVSIVTIYHAKRDVHF